MKVDAFLIKACKSGDRKAQYAMYTECYSLLMSICVRYMNSQNEAKAMVNQGFHKILNNLEKFDDSFNFSTWCSKIMTNVLIDDYRKNKKRLEFVQNIDFLLEAENFTSVEYNEAEKIFEAEDLEQMLQKLPKVSRMVFNMYALEGYKHAEIADKLGMSVNTSKWHLSTARKKLQNILRNSINTSKSFRYG